MKIYLRSTNSSYTNLALRTYLSGLDVEVTNDDIQPNPDSIVLHDRIFYLRWNPIDLYLSHISKYGEGFGVRSPLILNSCDGISYLRALGVIPRDFTSSKPNIQEIFKGFKLEEDTKSTLCYFIASQQKQLKEIESVDNYTKYAVRASEYYDERFMVHNFNNSSEKTYIANTHAFEIINEEDLDMFETAFMAYNSKA